MRVVAGTAKGRRLAVPRGDLVRPTTDRVRESMFNALTSLGVVEGARVLDLFAGTGALGIEALSRGAQTGTFVDSDRRSVSLVRDNLAATGLAERAVVVQADALQWLQSSPGRPTPGAQFDLALLDPPYRFDRWPELLDHLPATWAVVESDRELPELSSWRLVRAKKYGSTVMTFLRHTRADEDPEEA
jgi:16S rRNA (guanine(966)-N(2))-methyltransferase RsmD